MSRPFFSKREWRAVTKFARIIIGVGVLAAALFLLLSLASHDAQDPAFYSDTWRKPQNWMGGAGAMASDLLIRPIGLASYGVVLALLVNGLRLLTNLPMRRAIRRIAASPIALLLFAGFASSHAGQLEVGGGYGGQIGDFLFQVLATGLPFHNEKISLVVATLILLALTLPVAGYALGARKRDLGPLWRETVNHVRSARGNAVALGGAVSRLWRETPDRIANFASIVGGGERWAADAPLTAAPSAPRGEFEPDFSNLRRNNPAPRTERAPSFEDDDDWRLREPEFDDDRFAQPEADAANDEHHADAAPAGPAEAAIDDDIPLDRAPDIETDGAPIDEPDADDDVLRADQPPAPAETATRAAAQIGYRHPALDLLRRPDIDAPTSVSEAALARAADQLQSVLKDYGVKGDIVDAHPGPVVTQFELEPAPGLKASRVIGLADDIARSMSAASARVSVTPGRNVIGIELPSPARETVRLRELLEHESFARSDLGLPLALGKDITGQPVVADLAGMPHLLVAGTTGSGKSVGINTMLLSLLYRMTPEQVRLILVDPKMLELSVYNDAPHLLAPVVTDPKKAVKALQWVVREMEQRYLKMSRLNVRSLDSYNRRVSEALASGAPREERVQTGFDEATDEPRFESKPLELERLPYLVVVIDELADLMLVAGKEIEHCIQRLAQMGRACGIHLVMATQRPSVDVITGVIKANFPIRISFQVTSKIDSRTIIGEAGAEQLLGKGDMLYTAGAGKLQRIHGPFVSDHEVEAVAAHLARQSGGDEKVDFDTPERFDIESADDADLADDSGDDALYRRAISIVTREQRASTSLIQRRLQIGYNRAARLIERLEADSVVSPANHVGKRDVLRGAEGDDA